MKRHNLIHTIGVRLLLLILVFGISLTLCPFATNAATKSVTFTNINRYEQLKALTPFTIRWTASGGTVSEYTFSLRYLYNITTATNILI